MNRMLEQRDETEIATHSELSVEIKNEVYTSKVQRDICTLIGCMIDTFGNTAPNFYKVVPISQIKTSFSHGV